MTGREESPRLGMILNVIIVISRGISNLSADYEKGTVNRKEKQRKKRLIQLLPQIEMLLLSTTLVVLISQVWMLIE